MAICNAYVSKPDTRYVSKDLKMVRSSQRFVWAEGVQGSMPNFINLLDQNVRNCHLMTKNVQFIVLGS